jgi:hypothetical protein
MTGMVIETRTKYPGEADCQWRFSGGERRSYGVCLWLVRNAFKE